MYRLSLINSRGTELQLYVSKNMEALKNFVDETTSIEDQLRYANDNEFGIWMWEQSSDQEWSVRTSNGQYFINHIDEI